MVTRPGAHRRAFGVEGRLAAQARRARKTARLRVAMQDTERPLPSPARRASQEILRPQSKRASSWFLTRRQIGEAAESATLASETTTKSTATPAKAVSKFSFRGSLLNRKPSAAPA